MSPLNRKRNGGGCRGILCARQRLWRLASELGPLAVFPDGKGDVDMSAAYAYISTRAVHVVGVDARSRVICGHH